MRVSLRGWHLRTESTDLFLVPDTAHRGAQAPRQGPARPPLPRSRCPGPELVLRRSGQAPSVGPGRPVPRASSWGGPAPLSWLTPPPPRVLVWLPGVCPSRSWLRTGFPSLTLSRNRAAPLECMNKQASKSGGSLHGTSSEKSALTTLPLHRFVTCFPHQSVSSSKAKTFF